VPEREVAGLQVGAPLRVVTRAAADPGTGAPARITGVGAQVDREHRTATVEAVIEPPPAGWLPGMFAEAIVDRQAIEGALVVPSAAVLSRLRPSGEMIDGVLIADGEVARWVPVRVRAREGDRVGIEGEIEAGALVLVGGHVDLTDGARIEVTAGGGATEGKS
jgi:multidrug efflux pump subunit AcrA (membrane-fusion protein)